MKKVIDILHFFNRKVDSVKIKGLPRAMILAFVGLFFLLILVFIAAWLHVWWSTGKPDMPIFTMFFGQLFGPAVCGTVMLVGKALIDKDEDGIPDAWEEEKERDLK